MMTMALTGKMVPYKKGFGPMPADVFHVPFPIPHYGVTTEDSLKYLTHLFKADVDPARVAAIIIEPVQGEGGFHPAPPDLLRGLRKVCDKHGIILIADEVQTGFARTGKMFGIEHSGIEPDVITTAKSLAGGFPLSAVTGRAKLMDAVEPGGLGGTYAGSPIACAAGLAVLDVIEEEMLIPRARVIGERAGARLKEMQKRNDLLPMAAIRNLGAMIAFDLVKERGAHEPNADAVKRVQARALENGLVIIACGIYGEGIRLLMPLTVSDAVLDEGLNILEGALAA
jgi:4-aminobutyrate aminotransferase/(S)-3-amino-2-methylpropionate transaminase